MAVVPSYASTPRTASAAISAANTARNGTGTIVPVFSAGASGSLVHEATVKATGTTSAGGVVLFLNDGASTWAWKEVAISAVSASGSVPSFEASLSLYDGEGNPFQLQTGWSIQASTTVSQGFHVSITGADL